MIEAIDRFKKFMEKLISMKDFILLEIVMAAVIILVDFIMHYDNVISRTVRDILILFITSVNTYFVVRQFR